VSPIDIPNRPAFRPQEVCELAEIPPYVLRTWEAEFPDLGVAKTAGGARVYRRVDVELVFRIKQLLFDEGLTLAGVRRRFADEAPAAPAEAFEELVLPVPAVIDDRARERLREVRKGLQWILNVLSTSATSVQPPGEFVLQAEAVGSVPSVPPAKPARAKRANPKK
jgi:DNA-binding transcriptional MerR regulator